MKIRQSSAVKGISIFAREIKISQLADDTNLLRLDLSSVEKGLQITVEFGEISGLRLDLEKTKAIWLGKWSGNKSKPLHLKWVSSPTRILGIYFSYDVKGNNEMNFNLKIDKLLTNLDIWKSRDLTLFGKAPGVSSLIYSASNINVPKDIISNVKGRLFRFIWKNKRDKIRREGLYQDYDKGRLRMTDIETMMKALRLAWIPDSYGRPIPIGNLFQTIFLRNMGAFIFSYHAITMERTLKMYSLLTRTFCCSFMN